MFARLKAAIGRRVARRCLDFLYDRMDRDPDLRHRLVVEIAQQITDPENLAVRFTDRLGILTERDARFLRDVRDHAPVAGPSWN